MRQFRRWVIGVLATLCLLVSLDLASAQTQAGAESKSDIVPVKRQDVPQPPERTPDVAPAETAPPTPAPSPAAVTPASNTQPGNPTNTPAPATGPGPSADLTSGNIAAQPPSDLGRILNTSAATTGVEVQRRAGIVADPRVRGYRTPQLVNYGDWGFFLPARLDLDTVITKFDPGLIRNLSIIKGPYSVRYGPGFAFLDIVTFDSPRAPEGCDWKISGRTFLGYQSNGDRWNGLQSVEYGAQDWGFRATYNVLSGNDYRPGDGYLRSDGSDKVPGSYNSQNFSFAAGVSFTPNVSVEFKALRVFQNDVEFPGLYFDIDNLDTEAYSARLAIKDQPYYDLLTVDLWYNSTVVDGSTTQGYKQVFLSGNFNTGVTDPRRIGFLAGPSGFDLFNQSIPSIVPQANRQFYQPATQVQNGVAVPGFVPVLTDQSTTRLAESSIGYRAAMTWGKPQPDNLNVTVGSDFTRVAQGQQEALRILDPGGAIPRDNRFTDPVAFQNLGLPNSQYINPGLFLDANMPVNDRLTFKAGTRVDYVHTQATTRSITGNIFLFGDAQVPGQVRPTNLSEADIRNFFSNDPSLTNSSRDFGLWSGYLTSDYKFDDCLTGLMGAGYAMRPPTLAELYSDGPLVGILQPGINRLIGDAALDPERVLQFDVGLRGDYGWFKGSLTGFYAWINDFITYDLNSQIPGAITQVIFTNTDRATLAGGEAYAQVEATSWLTPFGTMSYVQGRDLTLRDFRRNPNTSSSRRNANQDTEPLSGIPPLEFRYGFRVHESVDPKGNPRWSVELLTRSVMSQNLIAASLGELYTGGFTTVDLQAYWRVTDRLLVNAGVENIGNRLYREHLDPRAGDLLFRPGTNFYVATQLKY